MKIDTSKIENYESMSFEEKIAALESYVLDTSGYIDKKQFDKVASEAANYKKQLSEKMTAEETEKSLRDEQFNLMKEELDALKKSKTEAEYTAKYISLGYDEALARESAQAYMSGDMEKFFSNQKKYNDSLEKRLRTDLMNGFPLPPSGSSSVGMTKEKLKGLPISEVQEFARNNPEAYKKIYEGQNGG